MKKIVLNADRTLNIINFSKITVLVDTQSDNSCSYYRLLASHEFGRISKTDVSEVNTLHYTEKDLQEYCTHLIKSCPELRPYLLQFDSELEFNTWREVTIQ